MSEYFQLVGDKNNPYHKSIGGVIFNSLNQVAVIKKPNGKFTLLRETQYSNESPLVCIKRGAIEELGLIINVDRFLGSLQAKTTRADGTIVEKSTDYFLCQVQSITQTKPEEDEKRDELVWLDLSRAVNQFESQGEYDTGANESEILKRVIINN